MKYNLITKLTNSFSFRTWRWRWERYVTRPRVDLAHRLASRHGRLARWILWPLPGNEPYRRPELHIVRHNELGDVLMCMPSLRKLKQLNPLCQVTFYTRYTELAEGIPFIDEVRHADSDPIPEDAIHLQYERNIPPRCHIARIFGYLLGFEVEDVRPFCPVDDEMVRGYRESWTHLARPWIVTNRYAGPHTPNKDWPDGHWEELIDRVLSWATVIETGKDRFDGVDRWTENYLNLTGQLSLSRLIAVIAAADLYVGPISGPVHVAAGVGTPSVVIYGGYEETTCSEYPGNINLYTPIPCSPCWLRTPCPYDKKCLRQIRPSMVENGLRMLFRSPG